MKHFTEFEECRKRAASWWEQLVKFVSGGRHRARFVIILTFVTIATWELVIAIFYAIYAHFPRWQPWGHLIPVVVGLILGLLFYGAGTRSPKNETAENK